MDDKLREIKAQLTDLVIDELIVHLESMKSAKPKTYRELQKDVAKRSTKLQIVH